MQKYFGPEGILASQVEGFEFRQGQLDMARAVVECFRSETPLIAEAGTGTGKTWAYLIPAILSGKRVIVSTGTKTLQDQILDKDIPFLKKHLDPRLRAVCLKGRRNYLCRRRFLEFCYQPTLWNKEEAKLFRRFQKWAATTPTGDRAEIDWLPDNFRTWMEVCSSREYCLGQQCSEFSRCHLTRVRNEAARAQVLVVNHHLFFADLSLRSKEITPVIPEYDAIVFDEAHQLEGVITDYFGIHFGSAGLDQLARDILRECRRETKKLDLKPVVTVGQQLEVLSRLFHHNLLQQSRGGMGRRRFESAGTGEEFRNTTHQIAHALEELPGMIMPFAEQMETLGCLGRHGRDLAVSLQSLVEQRDDSLVYWCELSQQAASLNGTPIDVAPILRGLLFPDKPAVVMTSATLSVAGSFGFLRDLLGVPDEGRELLLHSPFDYERQAIAYIPTRFPAPSDSAFCERMAEQATEIINRTRGRALFLFTSYRNMHEIHKMLQGRIPFPLLMQGQKAKRALLQEFTERVDSVLLATSSFWQGIDVPGESLSCLLIDKLPFEVPDDPVTAARLDRLARDGKNSFYEYQVPRAAIQLKQGIGRLIRSSRDRGVIALFDVRIYTKSYGQVFLKSLPPCRVVHSIEEIGEFFQPG
ncbi:MAG: ATP-dependent DNA helicase [Syntrophobacteraceae bacterium]